MDSESLNNVKPGDYIVARYPGQAKDHAFKVLQLDSEYIYTVSGYKFMPENGMCANPMIGNMRLQIIGYMTSQNVREQLVPELKQTISKELAQAQLEYGALLEIQHHIHSLDKKAKQ